MKTTNSKVSLQRSSSYHSPICRLFKGYIWEIWIRQQPTAICLTHPARARQKNLVRLHSASASVCFLNTLALYTVVYTIVYSGIEIDYYNLELRISQFVIAIGKSMYLFVWKPNNYFPARVFHWYLLINLFYIVFLLIWWPIIYKALRIFNKNKFQEI